MEIYFQIIWKRIHYIILTTVVAVAVITAMTIRTEPYYTSGARLLIAPYGLGNPDYNSILYIEQLSNTFSSIIYSYSVSVEAAEKLGVNIDELPDYAFGIIAGSELLEITATSEDPVLAQKMVETITDILIETSRTTYGSNLDSIEETLGTQVTDLEVEINELIRERAELLDAVPRDNVKLAEVERLIESREETYSVILRSYNETLIARSTQANLISVFEPADLPQQPSGPSRTVNIVLGIVIGLVGGTALAFFIELSQPRIYSDDQLTTITDSQIIGRIPKIKKAHRNNIFQPNAKMSTIDTFRRFRTKLDFLLDQHCVSSENGQGKSFIIASAQPSTGKSTVSVNLALAMAHAQHKVLLVDADIHKPSIHKMFSIENNAGITSVLMDTASVEDAIQPTDVANLSVLTSGEFSFSAVELLGSDKMGELIRSFENDYDYVIFDAAPILAISDVSMLAPHVCGVVLVTLPDPDKKFIVKATQELANVEANLLGIVINRTSQDRNSYLTAKYKAS